MKNSTLLALVVLALLAGISAKGAKLEINIIPSVGCATNSPNFSANVANVMAGLQNLSARPADWSTAVSWRPFSYLKWTTLATSTNQNFYLWQGDPNPFQEGPDVADEKGNCLILSTTVYSRDGGTWKPKDLHHSLVCSNANVIQNFSGDLLKFGTADQINLSPTAIGIDYDQNGNPIVYNNGQSGATPVKTFDFIGPEISLPVGNTTDLYALRSRLTVPHFTITYTVWHQVPGGPIDASASLVLFTDPALFLQSKPGELSFLLEGQPNLKYRIQSSPAVPDGPWTTIADNVTEGSWFTNRFDQPHLFFRAVTP